MILDNLLWPLLDTNTTTLIIAYFEFRPIINDTTGFSPMLKLCIGLRFTFVSYILIYQKIITVVILLTQMQEI